MADDAAKLNLARGISRFFDSPDLSDFSIVCRGKTWKVHRFVLSLHSPVLAKACNSDFKESKEAKLDLSVYEIDSIDALVQYLYKFDYTTKKDADHSMQMSFHANMLIIGDMYDVASLKTLAAKKFDSIINNSKASSELTSVCRIAYDGGTVTAGIRTKLVNLIHTQRKDYLSDDPKNKPLKDIMRANPDLAIDVAAAGGESTKYRCMCGSTWESDMKLVVGNYNYYWCPCCGSKTTGTILNTRKLN